MPAMPTSIGESEEAPCQPHQSPWVVQATDG